MRIYTDEFQLDFKEYNELSYNELSLTYIELFKKDKFVAYIEVFCDYENSNREYVCVNYEIIYLDTINKIS